MEMFCDRLRAILKEKRMGQRYLAKGTGIPEATISSYVRGKKEPGISKAKIIADYIQVDLNWLITGKVFEGQKLKPQSFAVNEDKYQYYNIENIAEIISILKALPGEDQGFVLELVKRLQQGQK